MRVDTRRRWDEWYNQQGNNLLQVLSCDELSSKKLAIRWQAINSDSESIIDNNSKNENCM